MTRIKSPSQFLAPLFLLAAISLTAAAPTDPTKPETTILILGDSLTAGYGLPREDAFPALVERRLRREGHRVEVINSGLSGETSAGGLRRVAWVMRRPVDVLVLALGANDGLRGLDPTRTRENLQAIIDTARERHPGIRILLAGMLAPPNMGPEYAEAFAAIYPQLASGNDLVLLPFLLEGVAGDPSLNLADGIHPNAEGHRRIAALVADALAPLLPDAPESLHGKEPAAS